MNGNGGGGTRTPAATPAWSTPRCPVPVVYSTNTVTEAANRDYAVPTYMALDAARPSPAATVGYEGTASDGLTQLDADATR